MSDALVTHGYERAGSSASLPLIGLSVALWALGVAMIRLAAPFGMFARHLAAPLFLATIPMAWLTVDLAGRVAAGRLGVLEATAVVSAPALLLDGVALTWAPALYGVAAAPLQAPAAWLLWFVGVSLAVASARRLRHTGPA